MDVIAERLARLCPQSGGDALRERAERYGVGDALERVRAAARSGERGRSLAADLDALDEAFARNGIDGLTIGVRVFEALRGGTAHPAVTLWGCPSPAGCSRLEPQEGAQADTAPLCGLTGSALVSRTFRL
ncbi:hypothetical protein ABZZ79_28300 [Streptomyces sp. NPDC006458]|uniref:hypothetical protein n=1 Tax=Streptomyces sp. NPDC006458 TaxID=3154302 RepID=UPI0033A54FF0